MRAVSGIALLASVCLAACGSATAAPPAFTPYIDVTLDADPQLAAAAARTGAAVLNLGFVIAAGGRCTPAWGGTLDLGRRPFAGEVQAVRKAGRDVRVSFGGQAGADLSRACRDSRSLTRSYIAAVDAYHATKVDFDVEGAALSSSAARARLIAAAASLRRSRRLDISLTLPVDPAAGFDPGARQLLTLARARRIHVNEVNLMTMDYGDDAAPPAGNTMAGYAIAAARAAVGQLDAGLPRPGGWWRHLGLTPMVGINDVASEVFTLDDARTLASFAAAQHVASIGMWSVARDRACPVAATAAQATCSGVAQDDFAFSATLRAPRP